jgi:trans-2,3-dihydro-3-hydroxyanthranilate isomerase
MALRYHLLDVFTSRPFGGNPLAVFPDAAGLTGETMQAIAGELGLSESIFLLPPTRPGALRRARIFTPKMELPFAGHPTLGAAHLLVELGVAPLADGEARFAIEEEVGLVELVARRGEGGDLVCRLTAAQAPERGPAPPSRAELARLLGLDEGDLAADAEAAAVSAGVPFLLVPVASLAALGRARLDLDRWRELLSAAWAPHLALFSRRPEASDADLRVRMFAPAMEIAEDPATGAAAAAIAAWLAWSETARDGAFGWTIEQGVEMGRPSRIEIEADKRAGEVAAIRVGGAAVRVGGGELDLGDGRPTPAARAEALAIEFLERVWGARHELDAIDVLMTPDYRITSGGATIAGRDAFKAWVRDFQERLGDARTVNVEAFADAVGERVVSRWICRGRNRGLFGRPADDRPVEFTGIAIWRLRDGRLAECWVERAGLEAYRALGGA